MEKRSILDHFQVTSGHSLSLTDNSEIHKGHKMKSNKLSRAYLKRFASSMKGRLSTSVSSFQSAPSRLEISELCILGFSCAIFLRWPRDQTMKAFIGLLMWSICLEPGPMLHWAQRSGYHNENWRGLLSSEQSVEEEEECQLSADILTVFGTDPSLEFNSSPAQAWPSSRRRDRTQGPVWPLIGRPPDGARRWLAERSGEMVRSIIGGCNSIKISRLKVMFQMFRSLHLPPHLMLSSGAFCFYTGP